MDESDRKRLLEQLRSSLSEFTSDEKDILEHCVDQIFKIAQSSDTGPMTLLLPQEDAFSRVGVDPEADVPLEHKDRLLALMIDNLILGLLPAPDSPDISAREYMTLAGAPIRVTSTGGEIVLTDGFGREARPGNPLVETPRITCRSTDNILMWDEWGWL
ncbi:MAG: hypothetical protein ACTHN4_10925 [Sphingomicrobium sp.]